MLFLILFLFALIARPINCYQSGFSQSFSSSSSSSCKSVTTTGADGHMITQQVCDDNGGPMAAGQQVALKDGKVYGTQVMGQGQNLFQRNLFGNVPNLLVPGQNLLGQGQTLLGGQNLFAGQNNLLGGQNLLGQNLFGQNNLLNQNLMQPLFGQQQMLWGRRRR